MKICLVCNEILGACQSGGIGTATSHLALLLARNGHSVTLFYTDASALDPMSPWPSHYTAANIALHRYPVSGEQINPSWMRQPVEIYEQLQYGDFDLILFQEWMALGHACMVAKRAGLAFCDTTLAVITHSGTGWILQANRWFPRGPADLALMHMEQQAAELADAVVSPSCYLTKWMREAGWNLPEDTAMIPYFLGGPELLRAQQPSPLPERQPLSLAPHLVFFGRLEERKGINIFLAALASEELLPFRFKLTFLGRPATTSLEDVRTFVAQHRPDLMAGLSLQANLSTDEAQAFLTSTNGIAVIPSLVDNSPCAVYECLKLRLPFVAASAGGIPELIHSEDWDRCLFDPTPQSLARKLRQVLSAKSWKAPRAAYSEDEIAARWLAWFAEHAPRARVGSAPVASAKRSDTTVVITHFERPRLVEQTLRALAVQTDRLFEVVLVDDGSKSEAATAFLDRASRGIAGLPIKVVRQSNKYVGAARNEGIRHAQGSFVIFLDDDNVPFPNMVEVFRRAMQVSRADIVTCQMQFLRDPTGEPDFETLLNGERWAFPGGPIELGMIQNCFGDATAIYKREVFERIGGFHEIHGVALEDWQFHLRAKMEELTLLSLPLPLFWYRLTPGSMTRTTNYMANMRVVASSFHAKLPRNFSRIVDFVIGTNQPGEQRNSGPPGLPLP